MVKTKIDTRNMVMCGIFTALIAVGAFLRVPIPIVPFTLQFLFTTLSGLFLGKKYGSLSVVLYILLGLIGLPIFAEGGGPGYIFKPSFGYMIGFCLGAYVTGAIAHEVENPSLKRLLIANFAGLLAVYTCGMIYYYFISNYVIGVPISIGSLFLYCFILAVPGDIIICILCAILGKRLLPYLKRGNI